MRWIRIILGVLWGGSLLLLGIAAWHFPGMDPLAAIGTLAAGQLIVMWLVADEICPGASVLFTAFCKILAGTLLGLSALYCTYQLWHQGWTFLPLQ